MRSVLSLVLASLAIGCISAAVIDWDAIKGDPMTNVRPSPPKRPAPPARPLPPFEEEPEILPPNINDFDGWNYPSNDLSVDFNLIGNNKEPPSIGDSVIRPFEPRPTPPALEAPPGPPSVHQPDTQPEQTHNKPHYIGVEINEPINLHSNRPIGIDVKPLDVVDGVVVPTPKYPPNSRPQIELYYEV